VLNLLNLSLPGVGLPVGLLAVDLGMIEDGAALELKVTAYAPPAPLSLCSEKRRSPVKIMRQFEHGNGVLAVGLVNVP
jgi:hypothetical protein